MSERRAAGSPRPPPTAPRAPFIDLRVPSYWAGIQHASSRPGREGPRARGPGRPYPRTNLLSRAHDPLFPIKWADRIDSLGSVHHAAHSSPRPGTFCTLEAPTEVPASHRRGTVPPTRCDGIRRRQSRPSPVTFGNSDRRHRPIKEARTMKRSTRRVALCAVRSSSVARLPGGRRDRRRASGPPPTKGPSGLVTSAWQAPRRPPRDAHLGASAATARPRYAPCPQRQGASVPGGSGAQEARGRLRGSCRCPKGAPPQGRLAGHHLRARHHRHRRGCAPSRDTGPGGTRARGTGHRRRAAAQWLRTFPATPSCKRLRRPRRARVAPIACNSALPRLQHAGRRADRRQTAPPSREQPDHHLRAARRATTPRCGQHALATFTFAGFCIWVAVAFAPAGACSRRGPPLLRGCLLPRHALTGELGHDPARASPPRLSLRLDITLVGRARKSQALPADADHVPRPSSMQPSSFGGLRARQAGHASRPT